MGGLGLRAFAEQADEQFEHSIRATRPIVDLIKRQEVEQATYPAAAICEAKAEIRSLKDIQRKERYSEFVTSSAPDDLRTAVQRNSEPGISVWLSGRPSKDHGNSYSRPEWEDLVALRYTVPIPDLPAQCGCGKKFSPAHAFSCPLGGFPHGRHNNIRDFFVALLAHLFPDVQKEPRLADLSEDQKAELRRRYRTTNLQSHPRGDLSVGGFWRDGEKAFFDVRVWNHLADSYRHLTTAEAHLINEAEKKREYSQRIIECENGSFTPLVFSAAGSAAPSTQFFLQRVALAMQDRMGIEYTSAAAYLRTRVGTILNRAQLRCLRGTHKAKDKTELRRIKSLPKRRGPGSSKSMRERDAISGQSTTSSAHVAPGPNWVRRSRVWRPAGQKKAREASESRSTNLKPQHISAIRLARASRPSPTPATIPLREPQMKFVDIPPRHQFKPLPSSRDGLRR